MRRMTDTVVWLNCVRVLRMCAVVRSQIGRFATQPKSQIIAMTYHLYYTFCLHLNSNCVAKWMLRRLWSFSSDFSMLDYRPFDSFHGILSCDVKFCLRSDYVHQIRHFLIRGAAAFFGRQSWRLRILCRQVFAFLVCARQNGKIVVFRHTWAHGRATISTDRAKEYGPE